MNVNRYVKDAEPLGAHVPMADADDVADHVFRVDENTVALGVNPVHELLDPPDPSSIVNVVYVNTPVSPANVMNSFTAAAAVPV